MRFLSFLVLPFVLVAMLVAPLLGIHFCREEAMPLLAGSAALPFVGPYLKSKLSKRSKPHCCVEDHKH